MEIKRILKFISKIDIINIIILTFITTLLEIFIPYIIGYIIDHINKEIFIFIIILLIFYILKFIISLISNRIVIKMNTDTLFKIRKYTFTNLEKLSIKYFDKNDKGNIMSILTNDIDKINDSLSEGITTIISSLITLIGVTIIMFYMNITLSIIVIITVPLFFIIILKMSKKMDNYFMESQKLLGELTSSTEEIISGIKTIKNLNEEKYFLARFDKKNNDYKKAEIKANTYSFLILPLNIIINNLSNILIIGIGSYLTIKGQIKIGSIIAFLSYASMFRSPITDIATLSSTFGEAIAGAKRIFSIIDYPKDTDGDIYLNNIKGNIEFKNVSFSYDKKKILKDINIKINAKETIAIVGETGSGKTTIINLLMRFYDIDKGEILIDNININDINKKSLRENIGLVLQETYLFKATIMENIKYGSKFSDDEVIKICKKIGADKFIERLPNKYNTIVETDGLNLSIGERQLIAIVRCILLDPKIVILDEATSEVDIKTEHEVYNGISSLLKNRTSIIIAHRLSTIKKADHIIVLKNGKIVEYGNHNQLLNNKNVYYDMYIKQFM